MKLKNLEIKKENIINENKSFNSKQEAIDYLKSYITQVKADKNNSIDKEIFDFIKRYEKIENVSVFSEANEVKESEDINNPKLNLSGIIKEIRNEMKERKQLEFIKLERKKNNKADKREGIKSKFKSDTTCPNFIINSFIQKLDNVENKAEMDRRDVEKNYEERI